MYNGNNLKKNKKRISRVLNNGILNKTKKKPQIFAVCADALCRSCLVDSRRRRRCPSRSRRGSRPTFFMPTALLFLWNLLPSSHVHQVSTMKSEYNISFLNGWITNGSFFAIGLDFASLKDWFTKPPFSNSFWLS